MRWPTLDVAHNAEFAVASVVAINARHGSRARIAIDGLPSKLW